MQERGGAGTPEKTLAEGFAAAGEIGYHRGRKEGRMDRVRIYIQEAPKDEAAQALLQLRAQLAAREVAAAVVPLAPGELPAEAAAAEFLAAVGADALPLTLVDGEAVVSMRLPAFGELAFWLGLAGACGGCGAAGQGCGGCAADAGGCQGCGGCPAGAGGCPGCSAGGNAKNG